MPSLPQPIPYQGSKRRLAPALLGYLPADTEVLWEPFCGSGALSIAAAAAGRARYHQLGDSLDALVGIWSGILHDPEQICAAYRQIWEAQLTDPRGHYDRVRAAFNRDRDPAALLFLLARCVKNAVRFNAAGHFNQSPDLRRLGLRPATLRNRVLAVHQLLAGRAECRVGDYSESLRLAGPRDMVYMDPPYMGVSRGTDGRYHQGLDLGRFVAELAAAVERRVSFLVSFDGRTGARAYGPALPAALGLTCIEVAAGRSAQSTLNGGNDETVESLYLSPALRQRLGVHLADNRSLP